VVARQVLSASSQAHIPIGSTVGGLRSLFGFLPVGIAAVYPLMGKLPYSTEESLVQ
jgi:hypothetical protein